MRMRTTSTPAEKFFRMYLLLAAHALARLGNV
ncbi:MAG: hypothetical protein JWO52_1221, partial [Gammaproteobacteria bacterium]|nr:hypothetical protein [Gammaproteobacteria bacterium]